MGLYNNGRQLDLKNARWVDFLQWILPKLDYRWPGFRKVRGQVIKRIQTRIRELSLKGVPEYSRFLTQNPEEWKVLDSFCYATVSRFYRDRRTFEIIQQKILPRLAAGALKKKNKSIRALSCGCCNGEEPYTLNIVWKGYKDKHADEIKGVDLETTATDLNAHLLERAQEGLFNTTSLKQLPGHMKSQAFEKSEETYRLKEEFKKGVTFLCQDVRRNMPTGTFDLIFCRNLIFTYFNEHLQKTLLARLMKKLNRHGFLIIGRHETLPSVPASLASFENQKCIFINDGRT